MNVRNRENREYKKGFKVNKEWSKESIRWWIKGRRWENEKEVKYGWECEWCRRKEEFNEMYWNWKRKEKRRGNNDEDRNNNEGDNEGRRI